MNKLFTFLIAVTLVALNGIPISYAAETLVNSSGGSMPAKTISPTRKGVADDSIRNAGKTGVPDDSVRKDPPSSTGPRNGAPGTFNPRGNPY